jgi:hypothetical protein
MTQRRVVALYDIETGFRSHAMMGADEPYNPGSSSGEAESMLQDVQKVGGALVTAV